MCKITCTGTREIGGMAKAFPLYPFKRGATGAKVPLIIGVGAGKFLGCERFCPTSPNLLKKIFVQLLPKIFSHKDHEDLFLV